MKVRFKKLDENAKMPTRAHEHDAGIDLYACDIPVFDERENLSYDTQIAIEIPEGYVGLVFPRSSICNHGLMLSNGVGVIDSNYRGSIKLKFKFIPRGDVYTKGDKIGQLIIIPYPKIELEESDELTETDRGEGGYGSTGR